MKGQNIMGIIAAIIVLGFIFSFWAWWTCIIGNPSDSSSCSGYIGLWVAFLIVGVLLGIFKVKK
jgi:hypothetical protein